MAMNVLSPMASPSFEYPAAMTDNNSNNSSTSPTSPPIAGSGTGLRRGNTLKAYLANKNKQKERQAINIIVDPSVLQQHAEEASSSSSENDSQNPFSSPTSPNGILSPVSGRRIDTDLEVLDKEKKTIEDQLASITQQLTQMQSASQAPSSPSVLTDTVTEDSHKEELLQKRRWLCDDLDVLLKKRRELLQSWARDYKQLKRSGSLARRHDDLFWVTTA